MSRIISVASGLLIGGLLLGLGRTSPGDDRPDALQGTLPPGSRAILLPIAIDRGLASFIKPGVRADILARDEGKYKGNVVVGEVTVLEIADGDGSGERHLTFRVSPLQARVLDLLQKQGKLRIALRAGPESEEPR